jgi:hypothetical protein
MIKSLTLSHASNYLRYIKQRKYIQGVLPMRHSTFLSALAGLLLIAGTTAKAETFAFSFGTPNIPYWGAGTLTGIADPLLGDGVFAITSATGEIDGVSIALAPPTNGSGNVVTDPSGLYNVDQVIYTGAGGNNGARGGDVGSVVDNEGLLFVDANGSLYNIYSGNPNEVTVSSAYYPVALLDAPLLSLSVIAKPSVSSVAPEPSSLMLFGTGILGVAGTLRRRFKA